MYQKRREPCVLFLEDVFGTTVWPDKLRAAGYQVKCFADHFQKDGRTEASVKDPRIIKFCAAQRWVLFTMDKNIALTHVETIKKTDVAIIATARAEPVEAYINAMIASKSKIERCVKKHPRPSFSILRENGVLTTKTIGPEASTRRRRPKEGQELPS